MLGVDDVEHFFVVILQAFKNDEVVFRLLDANDVNYLVPVRNLEWEVLLAYFTVNLVEPEHLLPLVYLLCTLCLKPVTQTLQMNRS